MKQPIKMPALSDTMEVGRLVRWRKQPGDTVKKGEILAEIETDKAVMDMEAFGAGTLIGPLAAEDREYPVGETLAWIGDQVGDEATAVQAETSEKKKEAAVAGAPTVREKPPRAARSDAQVSSTRKEAAHSARKKEAQPARSSTPPALETKAEAPQAKTPGPGAKEDTATSAASAVLERALAGRAAPRRSDAVDADAALQREIDAGPPYRIEPPLRLRQVIATTVSQAVRTPQFRISMRVNLAAVKAHADERDVSFTLLLAKACALTVREQPDFNAAWSPDGLVRRERVDVAIAMEAERGLLTPVVRDVAGRSVAELAEDWRALKEKIEHHRTMPQEYRGGTFYLSNLGMFPGISQFDAVVPQGASAILAVAAPTETGTMLTLTCDHRVVFGADAARFLTALAGRLGRPGEWTD